MIAPPRGGRIGAEPEHQRAPLEPVEPRLGDRGTGGQGNRREPERELRRTRVPPPLAQVVGADALGSLDHRHEEPGERVVEGELRRDTPPTGVGAPLVPVEQRVDVVAVLEHATVAVEPLHLVERPVEVLVVLTVDDPVDRQVRAPALASEEVGLPTEPQILQVAGGNPPSAGEQPRTDHAPGVEMVALVPPVVGHLVSRMGFDESEERASQPERLSIVHRRTLRLSGPPASRAHDGTSTSRAGLAITRRRTHTSARAQRGGTLEGTPDLRRTAALIGLVVLAALLATDLLVMEAVLTRYGGDLNPLGKALMGAGAACASGPSRGPPGASRAGSPRQPPPG